MLKKAQSFDTASLEGKGKIKGKKTRLFGCDCPMRKELGDHEGYPYLSHCDSHVYIDICLLTHCNLSLHSSLSVISFSFCAVLLPLSLMVLLLRYAPIMKPILPTLPWSRANANPCGDLMCGCSVVCMIWTTWNDSLAQRDWTLPTITKTWTSPASLMVTRLVLVLHLIRRLPLVWVTVLFTVLMVSQNNYKAGCDLV